MVANLIFALGSNKREKIYVGPGCTRLVQPSAPNLTPKIKLALLSTPTSTQSTSWASLSVSTSTCNFKRWPMLATVTPDRDPDWQHARTHPRRRRLSRPQCPRPIKGRGLHSRPEAVRHAARSNASSSPVIGHLKAEHRMGHLARRWLAATGYNFLLLTWLRLLPVRS